MGGYDRGKRDHAAFAASHIVLANVFRAGPFCSLGFDKNFPLPSEAIELVHEQAAEECLHGLEDVAYRDALFQYFVAVYIRVNLWNVGCKGSIDAADLRTLACGRQKFLEVLIKIVH